MSSETIPIILCGKSEVIGLPVREGLKPEIEVIHFLTSAEAGAAEIPIVMSGVTPPTSTNTLGTANYSHTPIAVVTGGSELYDEAGIALMKNAVDGSEKKLPPLAWVRPDKSVEMPPMGPEYARRVVERVRAALFKLKEEGKLPGEESGLYYY